MADDILHAIECDCPECLDKWQKIENGPSPSKCLCIHAFDGFETFKIDNHTIGVRPIWYDAKKKLPDLYTNVLVFADNKGTNEPKPYSIAMWIGNKWDFINHSPLMPNYGVWQDIGYNMDSEDVTHWMKLPEPPESK